jgi:hypothetical protein
MTPAPSGSTISNQSGKDLVILLGEVGADYQILVTTLPPGEVYEVEGPCVGPFVIPTPDGRYTMAAFPPYCIFSEWVVGPNGDRIEPGG